MAPRRSPTHSRMARCPYSPRAFASWQRSLAPTRTTTGGGCAWSPPLAPAHLRGARTPVLRRLTDRPYSTETTEVDVLDFFRARGQQLVWKRLDDTHVIGQPTGEPIDADAAYTVVRLA